MSHDVHVCFAYKNRNQAEEFRCCEELVKSVVSSLLEQGKSGTKTEFSHLSGKIKTCSDLDGADFIVGDPSHPNFQAKHSTEGRTILRPVPAIVILPDDSWGDKVNSVLKNPMYDIRGVFRASRLYASVRDADELGNFWEVMKT